MHDLLFAVCFYILANIGTNIMNHFTALDTRYRCYKHMGIFYFSYWIVGIIVFNGLRANHQISQWGFSFCSLSLVFLCGMYFLVRMLTTGDP